MSVHSIVNRAVASAVRPQLRIDALNNGWARISGLPTLGMVWELSFYMRPHYNAKVNSGIGVTITGRSPGAPTDVTNAMAFSIKGINGSGVAFQRSGWNDTTQAAINPSISRILTGSSYTIEKKWSKYHLKGLADNSIQILIDNQLQHTIAGIADLQWTNTQIIIGGGIDNPTSTQPCRVSDIKLSQAGNLLVNINMLDAVGRNSESNQYHLELFGAAYIWPDLRPAPPVVNFDSAAKTIPLTVAPGLTNANYEYQYIPLEAPPNASTSTMLGEPFPILLAPKPNVIDPSVERNVTFGATTGTFATNANNDALLPAAGDGVITASYLINEPGNYYEFQAPATFAAMEDMLFGIDNQAGPNTSFISTFLVRWSQYPYITFEESKYQAGGFYRFGMADNRRDMQLLVSPPDKSTWTLVHTMPEVGSYMGGDQREPVRFKVYSRSGANKSILKVRGKGLVDYAAQVIFIGNSLFDGVGGTTPYAVEQSFYSETSKKAPVLAFKKLRSKGVFTWSGNYAVSGSDLTQTRDQYLNAKTKYNAAKFNRHYVVMAELTNHPISHPELTPAQVLDLAWALADEIYADGFTPVFMTVLPRTSNLSSYTQAQFDAYRAFANAELTAKAAQHHVVLIDWNTLNIPLPDGTHFDDAGAELAATLIANTLASHALQPV